MCTLLIDIVVVIGVMVVVFELGVIVAVSLDVVNFGIRGVFDDTFETNICLDKVFDAGIIFGNFCFFKHNISCRFKLP